MSSKLFYAGPSLTELHERYASQGRIDEAAPVRSTSHVVVDAPVDRVWRVLADLPGWPRWYPGFQLLELSQVRPGARFRWKLGAAVIRSTFAVVTPGRELSWSGSSFGARAVDRHLLEPVSGGRTRVTMQESMAGLLLPALYGVDRLRAGHEKWLSALKKRVESG